MLHYGKNTFTTVYLLLFNYYAKTELLQTYETFSLPIKKSKKKIVIMVLINLTITQIISSSQVSGQRKKKTKG